MRRTATLAASSQCGKILHLLDDILFSIVTLAQESGLNGHGRNF
jgi:hypothetical protein